MGHKRPLAAQRPMSLVIIIGARPGSDDCIMRVGVQVPIMVTIVTIVTIVIIVIIVIVRAMKNMNMQTYMEIDENQWKWIEMRNGFSLWKIKIVF